MPETSTSGRRSYTAEQMLELRQYLDQYGRSDARMYVPHRRPSEKLQILAVVNFKEAAGRPLQLPTSPNTLRLPVTVS